MVLLYDSTINQESVNKVACNLIRDITFATLLRAEQLKSTQTHTYTNINVPQKQIQLLSIYWQQAYVQREYEIHSPSTPYPRLIQPTFHNKLKCRVISHIFTTL